MSDEHYRQVDEALRTYPLNPAPPTLAPRVAARLRVLAPAPRFQVMWMDLVLSLFAAGMLGLAWLAWQTLPPQTILHWLMQGAVITQQMGGLGLMTLVGGLMLAVGACGSAALILVQLLYKPRVF